MGTRCTMRTVAPAALAAALVLGACGGPDTSAEEPAPTGGAETASASAGAEDGDAPAAGADEVGEAPAPEGPNQDKRARCTEAIKHVMALVEDESGTKVPPEQRAEALDQGAEACAREGTDAELDCVLAAETLEDVQSCEMNDA